MQIKNRSQLAIIDYLADYYLKVPLGITASGQSIPIRDIGDMVLIMVWLDMTLN